MLHISDESIKKGVEIVANAINENKKRRNELIEKLIPSLKTKIKKEIVEYRKAVFSHKEKYQNDEALKDHLVELITDFDNSLHWLEEQEIEAFADIINKKPLVSFFSAD